MKDFSETNKLMLYILLAHFPFFIVIQGIGAHVSYFVLLSSLMTTVAVLVAYNLLKKDKVFGYITAVGLMVNSGILIQSQMGQIEMHFHIFATMAFLVIYRSWKVILTGALVIAVHHLALTLAQMNEVSLFGTPIVLYAQNCDWGTFLTHAAFVVFEAAALGWMAYRASITEESNAAIMEAVFQVQRDNNLAVRAELVNSAESIPSFNRLMVQLQDSISAVRGSTDKLKVITASINQVAETTREGYIQQSEQTTQIAAAVSQLTGSIEDVARNIVQISDDTENIKQQSGEGLVVVNRSIKAANNLQQEVVTAAEQIQTLESRCEEVGALVNVIRDISEQTNLLALNAAIEAARAGDKGRGFAVVADEVRSLAQRTNESTESIRSQMNALVADATAAVEAINRSRDLVQASTENVNRTGEVFNQIVSQIDTVTLNNSSVASNTEEQSQVVADINRKVIELSELVLSIEEQTHSIFNDAQALEEIASKTDKTVSVFRL